MYKVMTSRICNMATLLLYCRQTQNTKYMFNFKFSCQTCELQKGNKYYLNNIYIQQKSLIYLPIDGGHYYCWYVLLQVIYVHLYGYMTNQTSIYKSKMVVGRHSYTKQKNKNFLVIRYMSFLDPEQSEECINFTKMCDILKFLFCLCIR